MRLPKNVPSLRRVQAIGRLRTHRQTRAQEAVRAAQKELQRLSAEIEKLNGELEAVRAERQRLYDALPESMPRSQLLEIKRREHGCETRRINLTLALTQHHTAQEEAEQQLHLAKQSLAQAQRSVEKINQVQAGIRMRSIRTELTQLEIDSGEYRQYR